MKNIVYIVIVILFATYLLGSCFGDSSSSRERRHQEEVERVRDELYYKAPDGLWYQK